MNEINSVEENLLFWFWSCSCYISVSERNSLTFNPLSQHLSEVSLPVNCSNPIVLLIDPSSSIMSVFVSDYSSVWWVLRWLEICFCWPGSDVVNTNLHVPRLGTGSTRTGSPQCHNQAAPVIIWFTFYNQWRPFTGHYLIRN